MSSAALKNELLAARDGRHARLMEALAAGLPSTLVLSLNIPGEEKSPPGAEGLFGWGLAALSATLPGLRMVHRGTDSLGPFAILRCRAPVHAAKSAGIALESADPAGRLLDIDVYSAQGGQVSRRELELPPRPCLLCGKPAFECMRLSRHDYSLLKGRTDELLQPFRP